MTAPLEAMLGRLASGRIKLAAAVADVRARDWSSPTLSPADLMRDADTAPPANDWAIVEQARHDGRITPAQYIALRVAVVGAQHPETD